MVKYAVEPVIRHGDGEVLHQAGVDQPDKFPLSSTRLNLPRAIGHLGQRQLNQPSTFMVAFSEQNNFAEESAQNQFQNEIQFYVDAWLKGATSKGAPGETNILPSQTKSLVKMFAEMGVPVKVPTANSITTLYQASSYDPTKLSNAAFVEAAMREALSRSEKSETIDDEDLNNARLTVDRWTKCLGPGYDSYKLISGNMVVTAEYDPTTRHRCHGLDEQGLLIVSVVRNGRRVRLSDETLQKILPTLVARRGAIQSGGFNGLPDNTLVKQWHEVPGRNDPLLARLKQFEQGDRASNILSPREHAEKYYPVAVDRETWGRSFFERYKAKRYGEKKPKPGLDTLDLARRLEKSDEEVETDILAVDYFRLLLVSLTPGSSMLNTAGDDVGFELVGEASGTSKYDVKTRWELAATLKRQYPNYSQEELPTLQAALAGSFDRATLNQTRERVENLDDLVALGNAAGLDKAHVKDRVAHLVLATVDRDVESTYIGSEYGAPMKLLTLLKKYAELVGTKPAAKTLRAKKQLSGFVASQLAMAKNSGDHRVADEWGKLNAWLSALPKVN